MNWLPKLRTTMDSLEQAKASSAQAGEMLKEAYRANGWEVTAKTFATYTLARMRTAPPETIKTMHDTLQELCGELWKGIEP